METNANCGRIVVSEPQPTVCLVTIPDARGMPDAIFVLPLIGLKDFELLCLGAFVDRRREPKAHTDIESGY